MFKIDWCSFQTPYNDKREIAEKRKNFYHSSFRLLFILSAYMLPNYNAKNKKNFGLWIYLLI